MTKKSNLKHHGVSLPVLFLGSTLGVTACTEQLPDNFRFNQQEENFQISRSIDVKVDMLWVVDNSASMDASQEKLRQGFESFTRKYMKPYWNIQMGVIGTDTYLAHSSFQNYLDTVIPGSINYNSTYITSRLATWTNPPWAPSLVNLSTGNFTSGIRYRDLVPAWGEDYAKLLNTIPDLNNNGNHDGPNAGLCFEGLPAFMNGLSKCQIRDVNSANRGVERCLEPGTGEKAVEQCVNTAQNNTVHSGKSLLKTKPPTGTPGDETWVQQLIKDATINLTTGSVGHGSERHFSSVLQFLNDNEGASNRLFREGSIRVIVFITDENDQSMTIPSSPPAGYQPNSDYACDQAGLIALNGSSITSNYCCSGGGCTYGSAGITCDSKTVGTYTYTPSVCPDASKLISVASVKTELDRFFTSLDETSTTDQYFVYAIIPSTGTSIQNLHATRSAIEQSAGMVETHSVDYPERIVNLVNQVGNGSGIGDIGASNYDAILTSIGDQIIEKVGRFKLTRPPTVQEEMIVWIVHTDGSRTQVDESDYRIVGSYVEITNLDLILNSQPGDQVVINYQPKA